MLGEDAGEDAGEDKRAQGRTLVHHGLVVYIFTYKKPPHKIFHYYSGGKLVLFRPIKNVREYS